MHLQFCCFENALTSFLIRVLQLHPMFISLVPEKEWLGSMQWYTEHIFWLDWQLTAYVTQILNKKNVDKAVSLYSCAATPAAL